MAAADSSESSGKGAELAEFVEILAARPREGCGGSHRHSDDSGSDTHLPSSTAAAKAAGLGAGRSSGGVRVEVDGDISVDDVKRAMMTDADRDRPPVRTPSSVERIEASELESAEVQAAVIAKRLFSLHGRRVALYKQMDTAGSALTSAASSLSSGSGDDAAMGAVPAAVSGYQTTMEGIMRAMADVSQGFRDAEAAAVAIVGSGGSSGCTEAEE